MAALIADLGKMARLEALHLMAFQRPEEFVVEDVEVWTSPNGKAFPAPGSLAPSTGQAPLTQTAAPSCKSKTVNPMPVSAPDMGRVLAISESFARNFPAVTA